MSVVTEHDTLWSAMPGWGISANLMPPEVIEERYLRVVRRRILIGLVATVALCALGYGYALIASQQSSSSLDTAQAQTAKLQVTQKTYANVTQIQGTVSEVQKQVSGLMSNDVDYAGLIGQVRQQLPAGMVIGQLTVNVDTAKAATGNTVTGAAILDSSGRPHIGTITIAGTGRAISDVSTYVDQLRKIGGAVEPYPLTNKTGPGGTEYSIQVTLTDQVLTHKYDAEKNGGN